MLKAVFIDRDGVINELIFNSKTEAFESPHDRKDLNIIPGAFDGIAALQEKGFKTFLISNQPSFAKGKTTLEEIKAIAADLTNKMQARGIQMSGAYYCYHHPQGTVLSASHDVLLVAHALVAPWVRRWSMSNCRKPILTICVRISHIGSFRASEPPIVCPHGVAGAWPRGRACLGLRVRGIDTDDLSRRGRTERFGRSRPGRPRTRRGISVE